MSQGFFRRLFAPRQESRFFAWQIELTTRCPLQCRMCIREACEHPPSADMPIEQFRRLAPHFAHVRNVVLAGWGEPLMYRHLIEAIRTVKAAGAQAGFVTSAWGLDEAMVGELVEAGTDFIGISLAGATTPTHNAIRINSDLPDVLAATELFNKVKADRGRETPRLHLVYLLTKDNLAEITLLPDLAHRLGIGLILLTNMVQITTQLQNDQKAFCCTPHDPPPVLDEAKARARRLGIELMIPALAPRIVDVCDEDPTRNLFISVDGQVAPCVYLYPPVPSPITRIYCDTPATLNKITFGNIFTEPLERIWARGSYAAFRDAFAQRRQHELATSVAAALIASHHPLGDAGGAHLPEPPYPCRTCHRMLGL